MMQMRLIGTAVACMLALGAPALAANAAKGSPDAAFMKDAAQGGLMEVELGGIASRNGGKDGKAFGQHMVKDHGKANQELMALAKKLGVTLPAKPNAEQQAQMKKLDKLHGDAFDAAYLKTMNEDHKKDIAAFRAEAKAGKDPNVRAWAAKVLPVIEGHLKMNDQMLAHRGGGAGHGH